jgi:hypothetical protein
MPSAPIRRLVPGLAALLLAVLAPLPAAGQTVTKAELEGYRLTMANVERLLVVARNMKALENDAELKAWAAKNRAEAEDDAGSAGGPDAEATAISGMVAKLSGQPKLRRAVQSAGISPRDYALTTYMLLVSSMPVAAEKQFGKPVDTKGLPAAMTANIALVRTNWARISAMGEEMKKYQVQAPERGSDDEAERDEGEPA